MRHSLFVCLGTFGEVCVKSHKHIRLFSQTPWSAPRSPVAKSTARFGPSNISGELPPMPQPQQPQMSSQSLRNKSYFTYKGSLFTFIVCGGLLWFWQHEKDRMARLRGVVEVETSGTPQLGGPWTLVGRDGRVVSSSDLKGKYQLLYFGFTFCPDVCPQELEKQSLVIERLDKEFGPDVIQAIFITVDPGRDTVAQVQAYCKEFHPRLLGLTGTPGQIKKITRLFRVYFNQGIRTDDEDYLVDHSIIHYLCGKNGSFKDFFGKNLTVTEMTNKISAIIREDRRKEKERQNKRNKTEDCTDE
eukprot:GHVS01008070.1.p1 GENE.GHVS01008070.1~~GHVS01008070.1.p1  ORF type:complete len:301 (-),score=21.71 GHVS01008070.1:217-1119(-)